MKIKKLLLVFLAVFVSFSFSSCKGKLKNEKTMNYINKININELRDSQYLELEITSVNKIGDNIDQSIYKIYIHQKEKEIFISKSSTVEETSVIITKDGTEETVEKRAYLEESILKFSESGELYLVRRITVDNIKQVPSVAKKDKKFYDEMLKSFLDIAFPLKMLPTKEDQLLSSKAVLSGLANINIDFVDSDGNDATIKLSKVSSKAVSMSYKIGRYKYQYNESRSLDIIYRYPYQFSTTDFPDLL